MAEQQLFQSVGTKGRLVDRVVKEIQEMILEQRLAPGTKLPPERELAEQLGVSRTVVREAVHVLVTKGLLVSRRKMGTLVRSMDGDAITEPLAMLLQSKGFSLDELHYVRSILEVETAGLAAKNASESQLAHLAEIVARMETSLGDPAAYADADAMFHHCLAEAAGNALLIMLLDSIAGLLQEVRLSLSAAPPLFISAVSDHRLILEAVAEHSQEKARLAMRKHLQNARKIQEQFLALNENQVHNHTP